MTALARLLRRAPVVWALLLGVAAALATAWLRYGVLEADAIGSLCQAADAPGWCALRAGYYRLAYFDVLGWVSLGAAVASWATRGRRALVTVALAMLLGGNGLAFYQAGPAIAALLLALLRATRLGGEATEPAELAAKRAEPG